MRFILLLIVIIAILAFVQGKRHGCEWSDFGTWVNCVIDETKKEMSGAPPAPDTAAPDAPAPAAAPETPPATETPPQ